MSAAGSRERQLVDKRVESVARLGDAGYGAALDADGRPSDLFHLGLSQQWVLDPRLVEGEGARGNALIAVARVVDAGVATVEELEQVVLRLVILQEMGAGGGRGAGEVAETIGVQAFG
jgi:hypothetical protein